MNSYVKTVLIVVVTMAVVNRIPQLKPVLG